MFRAISLLVAAAPAIAAQPQTVPVDPQPNAPGVALVYADDYGIALGGLERMHPFDVRKYSKIVQQLTADRLAAAGDFHRPQELTREQMLLVHTPGFLNGLSSSRSVAQCLEMPMIGMLPADVIDRQILRAFRRASGGTILAARLALEHGIAINVGGGFHHAGPDRGGGFCVYADMPIAVRILQNERLIARALIVDLDAHQGNGTILCCPNDDAVFTFSMHQGDAYPIPKQRGDRDVELAAGTGDRAYLDTLRRELPEAIRQSRPDLVILQAGCDTLADDPLAGLAMTPEGIVARDAYVIDTCATSNIPVVMTLGGGYSQNAWKAQHASIRRTLQTYPLARRQAAAVRQP
jgi:histone deacetylase 11